MIDVLLATYRPNETMLKAQIDSICAQEGVRVNLIRREDEKGEGPKANFSALLAQSTAEYAAFSDQDDVWKRDKLSKSMACMRELESRHGIDAPLMVFTDSALVDDVLKPLPGTFVSAQRINVVSGLRLPRLLMQNFIAGHAMLFNAALRRKAGTVPSRALMHDCWLVLVAAAFGAIGFVDEPLVLYRQHGDNALGAVMDASAHCRRRAAEGAGAFRTRLAENVAQCQAFVDRFGAESPSCAQALANFPRMGWFGRRRAMFRHGLFKHGLFRNLALVALA